MQVLLITLSYSMTYFYIGYTLPTQVSPNKKAKLNTSFAFCFLCFCYQNFFFLHSHKLRMTNSTLTPMTAG